VDQAILMPFFGANEKIGRQALLRQGIASGGKADSMTLMVAKTLEKLRDDPVRQFSVFVENKVGRLVEVIGLLESHNTHAVALTILDTTDSSIVRMILDDPEKARMLFLEHGVPHTESSVLVVELSSATDLHSVLTVLLQAEVNILYTYSFLSRPRGKPALVLSLDDPECATHVLLQHQYRVLHQQDISR
jgi:hypothetical protein